jgi:hypothetical protein
MHLDANSLFLAFLNLHMRKTNSAHGTGTGPAALDSAESKTEDTPPPVEHVRDRDHNHNNTNSTNPPPLLRPSAISTRAEVSRHDSMETVVSMSSMSANNNNPTEGRPSRPGIDHYSSQGSMRSNNSKKSMLGALPAPFAADNDVEEDLTNADYVRSFCPNLLLSHLSTRPPEDIMQVSCTSFEGACMLADISGFSKFSGAMCSLGLAGLDDLHTATNEFLGHFVDIVYQYRGDGKR